LYGHLVLRDRDADADGLTGDVGLGAGGAPLRPARPQRHVTALLDASGTVTQRFVYDPYGGLTVLTGSWATPTAAEDWREAGSTAARGCTASASATTR
jgi:hypothetical protein